VACCAPAAEEDGVVAEDARVVAAMVSPAIQRAVEVFLVLWRYLCVAATLAQKATAL
jgi:hypothetical protein